MAAGRRCWAPCGLVVHSIAVPGQRRRGLGQGQRRRRRQDRTGQDSRRNARAQHMDSRRAAAGGQHTPSTPSTPAPQAPQLPGLCRRGAPRGARVHRRLCPLKTSQASSNPSTIPAARQIDPQHAVNMPTRHGNWYVVVMLATAGAAVRLLVVIAVVVAVLGVVVAACLFPR